MTKIEFQIPNDIIIFLFVIIPFVIVIPGLWLCRAMDRLNFQSAIP